MCGGCCAGLSMVMRVLSEARILERVRIRWVVGWDRGQCRLRRGAVRLDLGSERVRSEG